jgi:hypothetical protein
MPKYKKNALSTDRALNYISGIVAGLNGCGMPAGYTTSIASP